MGEINACLVLFGRITVTAKGDCFMRQKQRVVIYGLGWRYQKNKEAIESMPGIVAHCDQSEEKLRYFADGITVQQLAAHIDDYDVIYVAAAPMRVVPYLVDELHVPLEKIAFNKYEQLPNGGVQPAMQFYGQNNEDALLLALLVRLGRRPEEITYLEVGTNEPVQYNNTYSLYQQGAHGLCVDALPAVRRMMELYRPRDQFIHAAVTGHAERGATIAFYEANVSGISSLHDDFLEGFHDAEHLHIRETRTVPLVGINDLLAQMERTPDMLLIDAEGEDVAIAEGVDYEKYRPVIVMVELDPSDEMELVHFLAAHGYDWFTTISRTNAIFVQKDAMT